MMYLFYFLTVWFIVSTAYFGILMTEPGRTGAYWWEYIVIAPSLAVTWIAFVIRVLYYKWRK